MKTKKSFETSEGLLTINWLTKVITLENQFATMVTTFKSNIAFSGCLQQLREKGIEIDV